MSKQPPARDASFSESEDKKGSGINQTTILVASTVAIIVVILVSSIVNYALITSAIPSIVTKVLNKDEETVETDEEAMVKQGIMLDLGDFVLNLADSSPRRYLKINVSVELSTTEEEDAHLNAPPPKSGGHGGHGGGGDTKSPKEVIAGELEQYKPAIRDAVISVLSAKTSDELSSATGKEVAKEEIQDLIGSVFNGQREVLRISFGQFIIQ